MATEIMRYLLLACWIVSQAAYFLASAMMRDAAGKQRRTEFGAGGTTGLAFIAHPRAAHDAAVAVADDLMGKGWGVFLYDPEHLSDDPVSSLHERIEQADLLVVVGTVLGSWVDAEQRYAQNLGKAIVYRSEHASRPISRLDLWWARLRTKPGAFQRISALQDAFGRDVRPRADLERSNVLSWEKYISGHDFDAHNAHMLIGWMFVVQLLATGGSLVFASVLACLGWYWLLLLTVMLQAGFIWGGLSGFHRGSGAGKSHGT